MDEKFSDRKLDPADKKHALSEDALKNISGGCFADNGNGTYRIVDNNTDINGHFPENTDDWNWIFPI